MHRPLRVAIINDFEIVVQGLTTMLADDADVVVVEASTDLGDLAALDVDVVLYDTFGRVDAAERIARVVAAAHAPVLVFSWAPTSSMIWGAAHPGAKMYLSKGSSALELLTALHRATTVFDPSPAGESRAAGTGTGMGAWPGQRAGLSARESEVMALIAAGLTNDEIAERMFISINTVKTYVRSSYRKAEVTTRSRAMLWAMDNGFARPDSGRHVPS